MTKSKKELSDLQRAALNKGDNIRRLRGAMSALDRLNNCIPHIDLAEKNRIHLLIEEVGVNLNKRIVNEFRSKKKEILNERENSEGSS